MANNKTTGALLLGGATLLYIIPKIIGNNENSSSSSGGGGGGSFIVVPTDNVDTGLAEVGTSSSSDNITATKKELAELETQYNIYQKNLLSSPVSSKTSEFSTLSNVTKKGEATASYKTTIVTETTKTLGGETLTTQSKKQEKIEGTEWKVTPTEKRSSLSLIVNPYKNIYKNIFNRFKSTGRVA